MKWIPLTSMYEPVLRILWDFILSLHFKQINVLVLWNCTWDNWSYFGCVAGSDTRRVALQSVKDVPLLLIWTGLGVGCCRRKGCSSFVLVASSPSLPLLCFPPAPLTLPWLEVCEFGGTDWTGSLYSFFFSKVKSLLQFTAQLHKGICEKVTALEEGSINRFSRSPLIPGK